MLCSIWVDECQPVWKRAVNSLCVSFVSVYLCVCASFSFDFEGGLWDLIVLVPDHCLSFFYFPTV